jgi:hypothetical protein
VSRRPLERWLLEFEQALPNLDGERISLGFRRCLCASRGRLDSGESGSKAVWAASFIRLRSMVLDLELLDHECALRGILIHELFHFVWVRAGNPARRNFAALLEAESRAHARGELGESSEAHKQIWLADPRSNARQGRSRLTTRQAASRTWRDYVCESFCDTGAWLLCPRAPWPVSLSERWRRKRRQWLEGWIAEQEGGVRI